MSSERQLIWLCVISHFSPKIMLFFWMASSIVLVVVRTSWRCFSALASIRRICVVWALHSTSASSTYKRKVLEDFKRLLITLLTWDSSFIILGRSLSAMAVPCLIAWVAWCRRLLGAFQSRTPIRNNDNNETSLIFVQSTTRSHSAPRIIWAHNQSSKYKFGKTSFHQRWCAAVSSSPSLWIPWKVAWVIYTSLQRFYQEETKREITLSVVG